LLATDHCRIRKASAPKEARATHAALFLANFET